MYNRGEKLNDTCRIREKVAMKRTMLLREITIFLVGIIGIVYQIVNENVDQSIQKIFIILILIALLKEFVTYIIGIKNEKNRNKHHILYFISSFFSFFFFGYILIVISLFS